MSLITGENIFQVRSRDPQREATAYISAKIQDWHVTDLQVLQRHLLNLTRFFLDFQQQVDGGVDFFSEQVEICKKAEIYELARSIASIMLRAAQMSCTSKDDLADYVNSFWENVFFEFKIWNAQKLLSLLFFVCFYCKNVLII